MKSNYFNAGWKQSAPKTKKLRRSMTFEILNLFTQKLINPDLYENFDLTIKEFTNSLDFFERKISDSIYKVTQKINIEKEDIPSDVKEKARLQYECCIYGGELFLEAIDEMRYFIDHVSETGDEAHSEECDWKPPEHLDEGIEIAKRADEKIRKSLEIYNKLYDEGY